MMNAMEIGLNDIEKGVIIMPHVSSSWNYEATVFPSPFICARNPGEE